MCLKNLYSHYGPEMPRHTTVNKSFIAGNEEKIVRSATPHRPARLKQPNGADAAQLAHLISAGLRKKQDSGAFAKRDHDN